MNFLKNRLKEPSTWAAIGIIFQIAKGAVPPQYHAIADCVSVSLATLAGVTRRPSNGPPHAAAQSKWPVPQAEKKVVSRPPGQSHQAASP